MKQLNLELVKCIQIVFIFIVFLYIYNIVAGVDFIRYSNIIEEFSFSTYYLKNIVSWIIIYISRCLTDVNGGMIIIISLIMNIIIIKTLKDKRYSKWILLFTLFSPIGVLLCTNVLRQYISSIFMFLAVISFLSKDSALKSLILVVFSILSHEIAIFFFGIFFIYLWIRDKNKLLSILIISLVIIVVLHLIEFPILEDIDDDGINKIYAYLAITIFYIFLMYNMKLFIKYYNDIITYILFVLIVIIEFIYLTNIPAFMINRLLVSLSFLVLLFLFYIKCEKNSCLIYKTFVIFINLVLIILHPGARLMMEIK